MRDRDHAVIAVCVVLSDSVPVDARSILGLVKAVCNMDHDPVAPVSEDSWARDCPVHGHYWPAESIWCRYELFEVEPVLPCYACVWHYLGVVGVDIVLAPFGPCSGCVACTRSSRGLVDLGGVTCLGCGCGGSMVLWLEISRIGWIVWNGRNRSTQAKCQEEKSVELHSCQFYPDRAR